MLWKEEIYTKKSGEGQGREGLSSCQGALSISTAIWSLSWGSTWTPDLPPSHTSSGSAPTHLGFTGARGRVSGALSLFNVSVSYLRLSSPSVQPAK